MKVSSADALTVRLDANFTATDVALGGEKKGLWIYEHICSDGLNQTAN